MYWPVSSPCQSGLLAALGILSTCSALVMVMSYDSVPSEYARLTVSPMPPSPHDSSAGTLGVSAGASCVGLVFVGWLSPGVCVAPHPVRMIVADSMAMMFFMLWCVMHLSVAEAGTTPQVPASFHHQLLHSRNRTPDFSTAVLFNTNIFICWLFVKLVSLSACRFFLPLCCGRNTHSGTRHSED